MVIFIADFLIFGTLCGSEANHVVSYSDKERVLITRRCELQFG